MLKSLLLVGALAFAMAAEAHSMVPTARGGQPAERVVILPGQGGIRTYKAVPEKKGPNPIVLPESSGTLMGPAAVVEEDYPDEGKMDGPEGRTKAAQLGEEGDGAGFELDVPIGERGKMLTTDVQGKETEAKEEEDVGAGFRPTSTSGPGEDKMMTDSDQKIPLRSTAFCLVSENMLLR